LRSVFDGGVGGNACFLGDADAFEATQARVAIFRARARPIQASALGPTGAATGVAEAEERERATGEKEAKCAARAHSTMLAESQGEAVPQLAQNFALPASSPPQPVQNFFDAASGVPHS